MLRLLGCWTLLGSGDGIRIPLEKDVCVVRWQESCLLDNSTWDHVNMVQIRTLSGDSYKL